MIKKNTVPGRLYGNLYDEGKYHFGIPVYRDLSLQIKNRAKAKRRKLKEAIRAKQQENPSSV